MPFPPEKPIDDTSSDFLKVGSTYDALRMEFPGLKEHPPMAVKFAKSFTIKSLGQHNIPSIQTYVQVPPFGVDTTLRDEVFPERTQRPSDGSFELFRRAGATNVGDVSQWLLDNMDDLPEYVKRWVAVMEGPFMEMEGIQQGSVPVVLTASQIIQGRTVHHLSAGGASLGTPDLLEWNMRNQRGDDIGRVVAYEGVLDRGMFIAQNVGIMAAMITKGRWNELRDIMRCRGWLN